MVYDDRTLSTTFLCAINEPTYIDVIMTLLTCINNYYADKDEGYLPTNFCVIGLASQLHLNVQARAGAVVPHLHQVDGISQTWSVQMQGSLRVAWLDAIGRDQPPPRDRRDCREAPVRLFQSRQFAHGGRGDDRPNPWGNAGKGRYVRPVQNKGDWSPDLICDACCWSGHGAVNCNMLVIGLFIEKYKRRLWRI